MAYNACPSVFAKTEALITKVWIGSVVLNVGRAPHGWGMARFWWGVEVEDIMNQFW